MGLNDVVARSAARRAHVLVVEAPGHWRTRAAVERAALCRGWRLAVSPADADVMAVCGHPSTELSRAIEGTWHQMPGPRVRVDVDQSSSAAQQLEAAHTALLDTERHRSDARVRPQAADLVSQDHGHEGHHGDHEDHGGGHDHDDGHDHGGGHDHGDMEMSPSGIPLAEGGDDRDGLEMDVLPVPLGPVLPAWPAGLVLHCSWHGDVIAEARAEVIGSEGGTTVADAADPRLRTLDNLVSLLTLAGWGTAAARSRGLRDAWLEAPDSAPDGLSELCRKVRRSRTLRWALRGLRPLDEAQLARHGLTAHPGGDAVDRLLAMLDRLEDPAGSTPARTPAPMPAPAVAELVTGLDLGAARLVVAGLDIHTLRPGYTTEAVAHA